MNHLALLQHQAALRAQCPPAPPLSEGASPPVHINTWGEGGQPVLIIHGGVQGGLGGGPRSFAKQRALVGQGYQLRLVDRPGFGASPSRGPDDMEADAVWIAGLLDNRPHLVGHSWGGAEALLAAARRPEAVRSLVLIEPALQPLLMTASDDATLTAGKAHAAANMARLLESRSPAEYGLIFARSLGGAEDNVSELVRALEADPTRAANLGCALLHGRMAAPPTMYQAAQTVREAGLAVLVISGGWSAAFDGVGEITARLTGGRHEIVQSPDHFPQLSSPEAFNAAVSAFWRSCEP